MDSANMLKVLLPLFFSMATQVVHSATVVEYYNPDLDNYFITADPNEQSFVDSGAVGRWQRTGTTFPAGGTNQVCRFYGSPLGPNSHFYTADAGECAYLKSIYNPNAKSWKFESNDFSINSAVNGTCATGQSPVYRAYNNGFARGVDSNHRITPSQADMQQVVAKGWSSEGIVMCSGSSTTEPVNRANSARLVGGKWTFAYIIIGTFSSTYTFTSVDNLPSSSGTYFVLGTDAFGGAVVGGYFSSTANWSVLDPSIIIDRFYNFTFADTNHVSGCYYQISPPGSTNLSRCYAMSGSRSPSQALEDISMNFASEPSRHPDPEVLVREVASDTSPGFIEPGAVEAYLSLRKQIDR